ncbi:hypothetical protein D5018_18330 [Parashewanella curva]|uniref:Uncharacterized protein n=1 Tax=Parashewanella curva TaxID=2338552 RepID=A0A3L8PS62_9GAMM|nr:hypothetical protein [Parashewanella curva]RLV58235.1 hypothetical protein D5018_18330 [Parashewanella curva]
MSKVEAITQSTGGYQSILGAPPTYSQACGQNHSHSDDINNDKYVEFNRHDYQIKEKVDDFCASGIACGVVGVFFGMVTGGAVGGVTGGGVGVAFYGLTGAFIGGYLGAPLGCAAYGIYYMVKSSCNNSVTSEYQRLNV